MVGYTLSWDLISDNGGEKGDRSMKQNKGVSRQNGLNAPLPLTE
ncbi:MAG: hypothetical protein V7L21_05300 [Nostoc sp.]|nr:hypothetical protein [Nostoc sp. NMS9]